MEDNQWDFSAYEIDLSQMSQDVKRSSETEVAAADIQLDASVVPQENPTNEEPTIMTKEPDKSDVSTPKEETPAVSAKQPANQQEEDTISKEEIMEFSDSMSQLSDMVKGWTERLVDIRDNSQKRLPKGIRVSIRRLNDVVNVLQASKTIFSIVASEEDKSIYKNFEECRIPYCCTNTKDNYQRKDRTMVESFEKIKEAIDTENPDARTLAREMKENVLVIRSQAETLADAITDFFFSYPVKHEELAFFSKIAATGDEKAMAEIDQMIMFTGKMVIPVADAPAMIKALDEKDSNKLTEIFDRMIENQLKRQTS